MADIFGRANAGYAGGYDSSLATLTFDGLGSDTISGKVVVENVSLNYSWALNRVFSLTSTGTFLVGGRSQGRGNMGVVIGPGKAIDDLYKAGNICNESNFAFATVPNQGEGPMCSDELVMRNAQGVVINSVNTNVAANDMIVRENITFEFAELTNETAA